MPKANLGRLDRVLRFLLAFWWLGPWAPEYKNETVTLVLTVVAWIALIESYFAYCPLHAMLGLDTKD